jgi:hypothetical protein
MAKVLLLLCAKPPRSPDHYLASLPRPRALWKGASFAAGALGTLSVTVEQPTPKTRKLYPWRLDTVVRFAGMAKPKRDWTALEELAEAVLGEVGGVLASSKVVLARLPAPVRAELWRGVDDALADPAERLAPALEAALCWPDAKLAEELAAKLDDALVARADPRAYEALVALVTQGYELETESVRDWLDTFDEETTRLEKMLERADAASVALTEGSREKLHEARRRVWESWAAAHAPAGVEADEIVAGAAAGEGRARRVLATWCERHAEPGAPRDDLTGALARFSASAGPWPPALREPAQALLWEAPDEPLPVAALHRADARWVEEQLAARAAERRRYAELVAGINARNAARLRGI